jgi:hypothetical protein
MGNFQIIVSWSWGIRAHDLLQHIKRNLQAFKKLFGLFHDNSIIKEDPFSFEETEKNTLKKILFSIVCNNATYYSISVTCFLLSLFYYLFFSFWRVCVCVYVCVCVCVYNK